jgi:hypothetical protein
MTVIRGSAHSKYAGLLPVEPSPKYAGLLPAEPSPKYVDLLPVELSDDFPRPVDLVVLPDGQPSARKRPRAIARFPIAFCAGVAAAWLWQSYGDPTKEVIANSYRQLGWFAPRPARTPQNPRPADVIALAAPAAPSSADLDAVEQGDKIAATPTTVTSIDQAPAAKASGVTVESQGDAASLQPAARLTEVRPPEPLSEKGKPLASCFASASAVVQNHPGGWPAWTLKAPGHEGTMCWYAAARPRGSDHRRVRTTENTLSGSPAPRPQGWGFGLP